MSSLFYMCWLLLSCCAVLPRGGNLTGLAGQTTWVNCVARTIQSEGRLLKMFYCLTAGRCALVWYSAWSLALRPGFLGEFCCDTAGQINETLGAAHSLKSFGSMNNMSHCLRVIPGQESSSFPVIWHWKCLWPALSHWASTGNASITRALFSGTHSDHNLIK